MKRAATDGTQRFEQFRIQNEFNSKQKQVDAKIEVDKLKLINECELVNLTQKNEQSECNHLRQIEMRKIETENLNCQ